MKVTAIAVMSLDGKLTRWNEDDIRKWSSEDDWKHFVSQRNRADAVIMGRKTYDQIKVGIDLEIRPCRFVVTKNPKSFSKETVSGKLEFIQQNPSEFLELCHRKGYESILLVGGSSLFTDFAKHNAIDELLITIEPRIFGEGSPLLSGEVDMKLHLENSEKLNESGTILLRYSVIK